MKKLFAIAWQGMKVLFGVYFVVAAFVGDKNDLYMLILIGIGMTIITKSVQQLFLLYQQAKEERAFIEWLSARINNYDSYEQAMGAFSSEKSWHSILQKAIIIDTKRRKGA